MHKEEIAKRPPLKNGEFPMRDFYENADINTNEDI